MFRKDASSTRNLAADAGFPSFTAYYVADEPPLCPCCQMWVPPWPDIQAFYVSGPFPSDESPIYMLPAAFADFLRGLRLGHIPSCPKVAAARVAHCLGLWTAQP